VPSAAFPVKTFDGNWGGTKFYSNNPVAQLTDRGFESPNFKEVLLKAKLRQNLDMWTKGLSIEADLGYDNFGAFFPRKTKSYRYEAISPVYNQSGNITDTTKTLFGQNTNLTYLHSFVHLVRRSDLEGKMNYKRSFGNHSVSAMFLFHQSKFVARGINNQTDWRNFAGNIHYGYNNTYFFNATASYSGKNLLPEGNRYHFFPALSAAWLISNEHFLQNVSFLDLLKLKASWGIVGSDLLPMNDPYVQHYSFGGGYNFGDNNAGVPAMYEETLPTKDFTVEQSHEENVGINVRMFSHLSLKADLFYSHRTHILVGSGGLYSTVLGIAPPLKTNGIVDNEGFETSLNWQQIIGDISWNIGGWVSYTHNKIVNENEQPRARPYLRRTGREVGQLFGLQAIGFFKNQQDIAHSPKQEFSTVEPGDIKYKDQNGDDVINQLDEVPLGHHLGYPNIYYSFNLGIRYKGIGLSALFQGTGQYTAYLNTPSVYWPLTNNTTISKYYYEHRWTSSNSATATLPRLTTEANANNFRMNSIWLVSKAYLKLRYVKIYYLFPQSLLKGTHIHSIEVYAQGRDLYSWDHIPVGTTQEFGASYPIARFYSLGFNINF
jgi:TonB-linked SusC/RagA family outer membrane protein